MDTPWRSLLANRRVLVAFVVQVLGYTALLAFYSHGRVSPAVEAIRTLPVPVLAVLAVPAIPAVVLTVAFGGVLSFVGVAPGSLPTGLLASGDLLLFLSAYLVAVGGAWGVRRVREPSTE